MSIKASLVIDFGALDSEEALVAAELDAEMNNGKTQFSAGDQIYFKVYTEENYEVHVTSGSVLKTDTSESESIEKELLTFIGEARASAQKLVKAIDSFTWFGTELGTITRVGSPKVQDVKAANGGEGQYGVCHINYTSEFDRWMLQAPVGISTPYAILVVIALQT